MLNRICFRGFEPTSELKSTVERLLSELTALAPMDATWLTLIECNDGAFSARMDVYSKEGPFLADAHSADPVDAVAQLGTQIKTTLMSWHRRRALGRRPTADRFVQPFPAA